MRVSIADVAGFVVIAAIVTLASRVPVRAQQPPQPRAPRVVPTLAPMRVSPAFHQHRVTQGIDLLQRAVEEANLQTPPLVSYSVRSQVSYWCLTTSRRIAEQGITPEMAPSLSLLRAGLAVADQRYVEPYVVLVMALLTENPS